MLKAIHNVLISLLPAETPPESSDRDLENNPYRTLPGKTRTSDTSSQGKEDLTDLTTNPYRDAFIRDDGTNPPHGLPAEDAFEDMTNPYRESSSPSAMKEPSPIIDDSSSNDADLESNPYK